ncbi:MAG: S-methyl-5'-thioadenosine phosphorylase [Candidatus Diapherotrites archaeon]
MIGILGGSGIEDADMLSDVERRKVHTPYGSPSDLVTVGKFNGERVAFLSRHGRGHVINPSNVNYRANIFALKEVGVTHVVSVSAVGSLQDNIHPGQFVLPDQFIDRTTQRKATFFDGSQVAHVSMADPFCPVLRSALKSSLSRLNIPHYSTGTYVCIEGPRFSTKAESKLFQSWGGTIIGMTLFPEVVLAREAELCYATLSLVTDYDSFRDFPVTAGEVTRVMQSNVCMARKVLKDVISFFDKEQSCACGSALKNALI